MARSSQGLPLRADISERRWEAWREYVSPACGGRFRRICRPEGADPRLGPCFSAPSTRASEHEWLRLRGAREGLSSSRALLSRSPASPH